MVDSSLLKGISFGLVSGVITTLGMMIGLDVGTSSKITVILGVITIAIADAFSDSLGVHVSEESEKRSKKKIWNATVATFLSKLFFAMSFIIPLMIFELGTAVIISVIYGLALISIISYYIAKKQKKIAWHMITEHLVIAIVVITISFFVGNWFKNIT